MIEGTMVDVASVLRATLQALDELGETQQESLIVYALRVEILRVVAHLETSRARQSASAPVLPNNWPTREDLEDLGRFVC
jgi:hypothetical protein